MCTVSKVSTQYYNACLGKLHANLSLALQDLQLNTYRKLTTQPVRRLSETQVKLFYLYIMYSSLFCLEDENLTLFPGLTIQRAKEKKKCVEELMKKSTKKNLHFLQSKHWVWLKPKIRNIPKYKMFPSIQSLLKNVDIIPKCYQEERDFQLIHLLAERYFPRENPEYLLFLLEDANLSLIRMLLQSLQNAESISAIKQIMTNNMPLRYMKALKLILLLHTRLNDLMISYDNGCDKSMLKCMAKCPPHSELYHQCSFIICEYCKEILTFRDMSKRPRSFGIFLQTEMMEMRCYRDDSDRLRCLTCFDAEMYVSLSLGQPDRDKAGLCHGKRSCFATAAYKDRLCNACFTEFQGKEQKTITYIVHQDTCLTDNNLQKNPCKTCQIVKMYMGEEDLADIMNEAQSAISTREMQTKNTDVFRKRKTKPVYTTSIFEVAQAAKQRRHLIK